MSIRTVVKNLKPRVFRTWNEHQDRCEILKPRVLRTWYEHQDRCETLKPCVFRTINEHQDRCETPYVFRRPTWNEHQDCCETLKTRVFRAWNEHQDRCETLKTRVFRTWNEHQDRMLRIQDHRLVWRDNYIITTDVVYLNWPFGFEDDLLTTGQREDHLEHGTAEVFRHVSRHHRQRRHGPQHRTCRAQPTV